MSVSQFFAFADDFDSADYCVQLLDFDEESNTFNLNEPALKSIFLSEEMSACKVSIVSVAGAFRKGKSFLLNFFVRFFQFLNSNADYIDNEDFLQSFRGLVAENNDSDEEASTVNLPAYLKNKEDSITGFKWRGGSRRQTSGIVIWKQPFFIRNKNNEKIAVLLMDTQGTFDWNSTVKNCATIFALSTMLSSVQIYNITGNIQEVDLHHLHYFTEYGKLVLEQSNDSPFQRLVFLIRDWSYPYEHRYGFSNEYMEKFLHQTDNQAEELFMVRQHIRKCFEQLHCYLLPYPGECVATSVKFNGKLSQISDSFLFYVANFIEPVVKVFCAQPKKVNGKELTGSDLYYFFTSYVEIFKSDLLPEPKSIMAATAEAGHLSALKTCQDYYTEQMEKICGGDVGYIAEQVIEVSHQRIMTDTQRLFNDTPKMGGDLYKERFQLKLDEFMQERLVSYLKMNDSKNILKSFRFLGVTFGLFVFVWMLNEMADFIGVTFLSGLLTIIGRVNLLLVLVWFYLKISGTFPGAIKVLDHFGNMVYLLLLEQTCNYMVFMGSNMNNTSTNGANKKDGDKK